MTEQIKSRIDYYVEKLGGLPHHRSLAKDFNLTLEESQEIIKEYRSLFPIKKKEPIPVMPPNPAEPRKERIIPLTKQQFEELTNNKSGTNDPDNLHEAVVQHDGAQLAIRIISGIVALACAIRGFIVILEINQVIGWQAYINAVIFQGASAILPIVGIMYLSMTTKKTLINMLFGLFYISGGIGSMVYEVYASSQAFYQVNVKQENLSKKDLSNVNDPILLSIQENINLEKTNMDKIVSNISKRRQELTALEKADPVDPVAVKLAQGRVSANLSDQTKSQDKLNDLSKQRTERLLKLESNTDRQSSLSNLVVDNTIFNLTVTIIPSIMMVLFTPVFFGIALFGVRGKVK